MPKTKYQHPNEITTLFFLSSNETWSRNLESSYLKRYAFNKTNFRYFFRARFQEKTLFSAALVSN